MSYLKSTTLAPQGTYYHYCACLIDKDTRQGHATGVSVQGHPLDVSVLELDHDKTDV